METLTARQQEVLDCIREFAAKHRYAPTVREIADELGIASPNGVMGHLRALEKKGHITRGRNSARGIALTERPRCPRCDKEI